jgi:hypothetical protein
MEPQNTQTTVVTASQAELVPPDQPAQPEPQQPAPAPPSFIRCRARNRSGRRCRLHVKDPVTCLCFKHIGQQAKPDSDDTDISGEVFLDVPVEVLPDLTVAKNINEMVCRVVVLLAEGRISARRASILIFGASQLLRSIAVMDSQGYFWERRPLPEWDYQNNKPWPDDTRFPPRNPLRPWERT